MSKPRNIGEAKPGVAGKALPPMEAAAKSEGDRVVAVVAKRMGFYGNARKPIGSEFNVVLAPGQKLPSWVEAVGEKSEAPAAPAASEEAASESADVI
jgi:hypothetical protein